MKLKTIIYALSLSQLPLYAQTSITLDTIEVIGEDNTDYISTENTTATGLKLSARETPQNTTTITQSQIQDQNLTNLKDLLNATTGIDVQAIDRGRYYFRARGFDIDKVMIDGMDNNYNLAWMAGETLGSLSFYEQAEITRGATGLMTGAGNPSAAINLKRKQAQSTKPETLINPSMGSHQNIGFAIDHQQALTKDGNIRGRIILDHQQGKSSIDWEKRLNTNIYAIINADLGANTESYFGISHQDLKQKNVMWGGLPAFDQTGEIINWPRNKSSSTKWTRWNSQNTHYFTHLKHHINDNWNITADIDYALNQSQSRLFYFSGSELDLTNPSAWFPWPGRYEVKRKQWNARIQSESNYQLFGRPQELIIGAKYSHNNLKAYSFNNTGTAPATNFLTWDGSYPEPQWTDKNLSLSQKIQEYGLYFATRIKPTEQLSFILGSRFNTWKINDTNTRTKKSATIPYAGIVYDFYPEHSLYLSYTNIYKVQTERNSQNQLLEPLTGNSYEIGLKSEYFQQRLQSQISLFYSKQKNYAEDTGQFITGTYTTAYIPRNPTIKGFELELTGNITDHWKLSAGYSQWQAKNRAGLAIQTTSPRKQLKIFSHHTLPQLNNLELGIGMRWQSERYATVTTSVGERQLTQPSYALWSLMANYSPSKNLELQLNIDNLFNKTYKDQLGSFGQYNYGNGREATLNLRYHLN